MSAELMQKMTLNKNSVHFCVFHSAVIRYVLFTINDNYTLNIHAEALINQHTIASDLTIMKAQFNSVLNRLVVANGGPIDLKISIFISSAADLFIVPRVFLPISDFMITNPCSLYYHILRLYDISNYISDVSNSLPAIGRYIRSLVRWCNRLFEVCMETEYVNDYNAESLWNLIRAGNQLIRYLEAISSLYGPIDIVDTQVSEIMEELSYL